jgi:hypothetical protein
MEFFENGIYTVSIKAEQLVTMRDLDPVLHLNEAIAIYDGEQFIGYKIGDNETPWSKLPFVDKIDSIKECWLYVPDNNYPGNVRVAGKILLRPKIERFSNSVTYKLVSISTCCPFANKLKYDFGNSKPDKVKVVLSTFKKPFALIFLSFLPCEILNLELISDFKL